MSDLSPPKRLPFLDRWFLAHPATVDETYLQHMRFALGFSFWLIVAGLAALTHALLPAVCETTASRILAKLTARMAARH
ncbi:DUF6356 family protein [Octadecabacter sp. 1_MG-2023]|uniref:DUF6356 family protein n=1 Tax=unclassified Octadecabacter TaxID=196158 RepID=UPI001C08208D|nr:MULTISPECIES: DUF6356 family protein [unclassified Octadecabacter]MBU2994157.1 hypothetical protein [Octadecabacter sp. B2R22]MDO6734554.1 DUF6356 family protein [Octadecabacter sp. 1_MG-2023]